MTNFIQTQELNGVFTITLNRLEKKNALNTAMYQSLCQHFNHAMATNSIHCVVIQGDNTCFTAGNDLEDFINLSAHDDLVALEFVKVLAKFTKPLVAAVSGPAVGIGTTLLLHCDMVFATNSAKFKLPFTQLGLCPEAGSSYLLPQLLGHNRAFELLVLGDTFNVEKAYELGFINEICDANELLPKAEKCAQIIAQLPSDAVLTSKRLIRKASQAKLDSVIKEEGDEFSRLVQTPECKKILQQFFSAR